MRLRSLAVTAVATALVTIPFGAAAFTAGTYDVPDAGTDTQVVVADDGSVTVTSTDGFAWDVETSDAEIEFLFITDSEDAAFSVSLDEDDDGVTVNVKPRDWDKDKIEQVLSDDDDDDDDDEAKDAVEVCHRDRTLEIGADGLADHLEHGDTAGACADDGGGDDGPDNASEGRALGQDRDPEAEPGTHGRDNAREAGGNAHGRDDAPGRQDD